MMSQELTYRHIGPDDDAPFDNWYNQIKATPCTETSDVKARGMIEAACKQECEHPGHRTNASFVVCLDREKLVGMLKYEIGMKPYKFICIGYFAVMPLYQGRGIGQRLLKELQEVSAGRYPLFAGPVEKPAVKRLKSANFQTLPRLREGGHTVYKWTDIPVHMNTAMPFPEDDLK